MNKDLLKGKIFSKGKTMEEVYKSIGISKSAMNRKMNDISCFTSREIKGIVDFLNLTTEEMTEIFFNNKVS